MMPLERLYCRLGWPAWFWPLVLVAIFALFVIGSSFESWE